MKNESVYKYLFTWINCSESKVASDHPPIALGKKIGKNVIFQILLQLFQVQLHWFFIFYDKFQF